MAGILSAPRALIARTAEVAHPLAVGDWPAAAHPVRKAAARMAEAISGRVLFNLSVPFEMGLPGQVWTRAA
jgi:hypothetical protein